MTPTPTRSTPPIALVAVGALMLLALVGVVLGHSGGSDGPAAASSGTATPTPLTIGGTAWAAPTSPPTAAPTTSPSDAPATPTAVPTPSPTSTPTATPPPPSTVRASVQVCRERREGRCVGELEQVRDGFVVLVNFAASSRGDTFGIHLEGPGGKLIDGGSFAVNGGAGYAWSTFRGGLAAGEWVAVATRNATEIARTTFTAG